MITARCVPAADRLEVAQIGEGLGGNRDPHGLSASRSWTKGSAMAESHSTTPPPSDVHPDLYGRTASGNLTRTFRPGRHRKARMRLLVFGRDDYTCQICRYRPPADRIEQFKAHPMYGLYGLELDHIFPYKLGGQYVEENLQTLCPRCNQSKGAKV